MIRDVCCSRLASSVRLSLQVWWESTARQRSIFSAWRCNSYFAQYTNPFSK